MARNDKHLAVRLRAKGKSYYFISQELGIPKSTLSGWFSGLRWSNTIKSKLTQRAAVLSRKRFKLVAQANKARWQTWREQHRLRATKEFPRLWANPLFIAGVMIYWAEGDNKMSSGVVRLANVDHRMIKIFISFAKKICGVKAEDIRLGLILYPDLDDTNCKNFWSKCTGIPISQFYKTQVIKGSHPTRRLEHGICLVKVGGVALKEQIVTWIDLCSKELMRV